MNILNSVNISGAWFRALLIHLLQVISLFSGSWLTVVPLSSIQFSNCGAYGKWQSNERMAGAYRSYSCRVNEPVFIVWGTTPIFPCYSKSQIWRFSFSLPCDCSIWLRHFEGNPRIRWSRLLIWGVIVCACHYTHHLQKAPTERVFYGNYYCCGMSFLLFKCFCSWRDAVRRLGLDEKGW